MRFTYDGKRERNRTDIDGEEKKCISRPFIIGFGIKYWTVARAHYISEHKKGKQPTDTRMKKM